MDFDALLVALAVEEGAAKAQVIAQEKIVLSDEFYDICKSNACGQFGRCHMCPPDVGDIHTLMARVSDYPKALIYQTISPLEDSYDWEGMQAASKNHAMLSQRFRARLDPMLKSGNLHLSCGGCGLCDECTKVDGLPCRFPEDAMASMESYGVDVYKTTKDTNLKYINGPNTVTFFGLALFKEA